MGVLTPVQTKLSRALHAHFGKLLHDLQNLDNEVGSQVRFRGAREKGVMAFVEKLGVSQEDTGEGPCGMIP